MAVNSLGGGGSVTGVQAAVGTFVVTVFTTPSTADYIYEVDLQIGPSMLVAVPGIMPSAGILWATEGPQGLPSIGGISVNPQIPYGGGSTQNGDVLTSTGSAYTVRTGGRVRLKVGPSTVVTVVGQAFSATSTTWAIAYNYVGYKIT